MNLDQSHQWNNKVWTSDRVAILPVRMQPPHAGHMNLLFNLAERFQKVVALVYRRPVNLENPFTVEDRIRWVKSSLISLGLCEEKIDLVPTDGISSWPADKIRSNLAGLSGGLPHVLVSFNPDTLVGCARLDLTYIKPPSLDKRVEMSDVLFVNLNNNATQVRKALKQKEPLPKWYVLPGVTEDEIRSKYPF